MNGYVSEKQMDTDRRAELTQERKNIAAWDRATLEDKYLRLTDDHLILKKYARQQENNIKSLGTKFKKLEDNTKKMGNMKNPNIMASSQKAEFEDLKIKISKLNNENKILKDKLKIFQNQPVITGKKYPPGNLSAKIDTGIPKNRKKNMRSILPSGEAVILSQRSVRDDTEDAESIVLSPVMNWPIQKSSGRQDESNYKNEMDTIRMRKELNDKEYRIREMSISYEKLRVKQDELEEANYELSKELQIYKDGAIPNQRKVEDASNLNVMRKRITDLELTNHDYKKEIMMLRQANEELTNKAFDVEREREWREKELRYRAQIAQLEKTLRMDVGEKGGILDEYQREREKMDKLESEMSSLRLRNFELQGRVEDAQKQLKMYNNKDISATPQEIQEALYIVQQNRKIMPAYSTPNLTKKTESNKDDMAKRVQEEQMKHYETMQELEKTRNLLRTQYKIANDYKNEADKISKRLDDVQNDYENRLTECAKLLDIRAGRIQKLEQQLKDIGYGTRGAVIAEIDDESGLEFDQVTLERGENVIEIHIGKVSLEKVAIDNFRDSSPLLFGTVEFLDFETQATGILRDINPDFDMTAEYIVKIDEFLLDSLYKKTFIFELHQAIGKEYETIAAGKISCKELLTRLEDNNNQGTAIKRGNSGMRYLCTSRLISLYPNIDGNFGVLEYWIRLRYPMDQIIRQYNEKLKAQGYLRSNEKADRDYRKETEKDNLTNEVIIRILRCEKIHSVNRNVQPSPYITYKFMDNAPHFSEVIQASNNPEFHDIQSFHVDIGSDLHRFLSTQDLEVILIDNLNPDTSSYIGIAKVPLIGLSQNKKVKGTYELLDKQRKPAGTVDIECEWLNNYTYGSVIETVQSIEQPKKMDKSKKQEEVLPAFKNQSIEQPKKMDKSKKQEEIFTPSKNVRNDSATQEYRNDSPNARKEIGSPETPKGDHYQYTPDYQTPSQESRTSYVKPQSPDSRMSVIDDKVATSDEQISTDIRSPPGEEVVLGERKPKPYPRNIDKPISENTDLLITTDIPISRRSESPVDSIHEDITISTRDQKSQRITSPDVSTTSTKVENQNNQQVEENSDVIVPAKRKGKKKKKQVLGFTFEISSVELEENANKLLNDIENYGILVSALIQGIDQSETDSPSLGIPSKGYPKRISFNFKKTFDNLISTQYQVFGAMILGSIADEIKLIVSLEPKNPDEDLIDIAQAIVHLKPLLQSGKDPINENILLYHIDKPNLKVGHIEYSLEIVDFLRSIESRLEK